MSKPGVSHNPLTVAIIGSGPSGFYAADALLKTRLAVRINMFERLPTPYGLVRSGVAPDHPKLKTAINLYKKIEQAAEFNFIGNIRIGEDISVEELRASHHALIFACGAQTDRQLGIPGEELAGSHAATEFVGWYNGNPDYRQHNFDLSREVAVVIGQGNVASDVARILSKTVDELRHTDIAEHALEALAESKVRDIHIIGRRGPVQAKFSSKELKEFGKLKDCQAIVNMSDLDFDLKTRRALSLEHNRGIARNIEIFHQFAAASGSVKQKRCHFHFLQTPKTFIGQDSVEKIVLEQNRLEGELLNEQAKGTGKLTELDCGLVFRSIGYRGVEIPGVPFDEKRGVIPNLKGQVIDKDGKPIDDMYVTGWIKRGPSGVIGSNILDSAESVDCLLNNLEHLKAGNLNTVENLYPKDRKVVRLSDWRAIDAAEIKRGQKLGKPREKFTRVDEMLAIL